MGIWIFSEEISTRSAHCGFFLFTFGFLSVSVTNQPLFFCFVGWLVLFSILEKLWRLQPLTSGFKKRNFRLLWLTAPGVSFVLKLAMILWDTPLPTRTGFLFSKPGLRLTYKLWHWEGKWVIEHKIMDTSREHVSPWERHGEVDHQWHGLSIFWDWCLWKTGICSPLFGCCWYNSPASVQTDTGKDVFGTFYLKQYVVNFSLYRHNSSNLRLVGLVFVLLPVTAFDFPFICVLTGDLYVKE